MFMVLSSCLKHCGSSPWFTRRVQHGTRWPPTFGPSRSAWTISPLVGCQLSTLTIANLLLLSPKADTHFTIPRKVEGWVDLVGFSTYWDCLPARRSHTVTHPSTNQARRRVTTLIKTNALLLSHATNVIACFAVLTQNWSGGSTFHPD